MKPTVILPAVTEPTLEEQVAGLTETVRRLAKDRYTAMEERDRACTLADIYKATATTQTARAEAAEAALEGAVAESRRDKQRCRELGADRSALEAEVDRLQRELAQAKHQLKQREKRWPFSRTGNQL